MKKRRRSPSTLGITVFTLWVFLCSYVFLYCKIIAIGYTMQEKKNIHEELTMVNKNYRAEILRFSSPENLLKTAKLSGINLISPSEWCYVDIRNEKAIGVRINDTAEAGTR